MGTVFLVQFESFVENFTFLNKRGVRVGYFEFCGEGFRGGLSHPFGLFAFLNFSKENFQKIVCYSPTELPTGAKGQLGSMPTQAKYGQMSTQAKFQHGPNANPGRMPTRNFETRPNTNSGFYGSFKLIQTRAKCQIMSTLVFQKWELGHFSKIPTRIFLEKHFKAGGLSDVKPICFEMLINAWFPKPIVKTHCVFTMGFGLMGVIGRFFMFFKKVCNVQLTFLKKFRVGI